MAAKVLKHKCPQNHACPAVKVCKLGALVQEGHNAPVVNEAKCTDCYMCVKYCPMGALVK